MPCHVRLGQLDADSKDTDREDDSGDLERDVVNRVAVAVAPAARVEYVGAVRAWK